jgi:predicted nicotinamide N-methyase
LGRAGLPPPFWAAAWPGGQAISRYVLDNAEGVRGLAVLDLGSGSGLCAIAAAMAGAGTVEAAEIDPFAREAIRANALLNQASIATIAEDIIGAPSRWDVVLAGDLWYERFLASRVTSWLCSLAREGTAVFLGDSGRAFFPRTGAVCLARYEIPTSPSFEREDFTMTGVWKVATP